jgi:hypothetical protein
LKSIDYWSCASRTCHLCLSLEADISEPSAIKDAKKAIDMAAKAMLTIGKFEEDITTHEAGKAFVKAEASMEACFMKYGVRRSSTTSNFD